MNSLRRLINIMALPLGLLAAMQPATGLAQSLYSQDDYLALTADNRAVRVGDKLTVLVHENTSAVSSADTSTAKDSSFGSSASLQATPNHYIGGHGGKASIDLDIDRSATGKGKTERSGKIAASITVVVTAVEPNGDVTISGEKTVAINDESQLIRVTGSVRKGDIQSDNTVESNRLANVNIAIKGEGDLTNAQRQGWLTKLFDWLRIF